MRKKKHVKTIWSQYKNMFKQFKEKQKSNLRSEKLNKLLIGQ